MSLRRLTAAFLAAFLIACIATGAATYLATRHEISRLVDDRISSISDAVATPPLNTRAVIARIEQLSRQRDTGDIGLLLADASGRRLAGNIELTRLPRRGFSTLHRDDGIAGLTQGRALTRDIGDGLTLVTIAETEPVDDFGPARLRIFIAGFGAIVVIVLAGLAAFSLLVARRIGATRDTAEAIIRGDLAQRVPVAGRDDVFERQAIAFNHMLDRIGELMDGLKHISDDIAHDLRAPLSRLRAQVTAIGSGREDDALRRDIDAALFQCDEVLALLTAILRLAEVESGARARDFLPIDIAALAEDVSAMMEPVAEETDHRVMCKAGAPRTILGDRQLLIQALVNLIENALAHTPPGTTIRVAVEATDGGVALSVADDGPGIPAELRATAMRRFGRLDASRVTPGHGVGLPLVQAIARLHGGDFALGDAGPGLVAMLTFPRLGGAA